MPEKKPQEQIDQELENIFQSLKKKGFFFVVAAIHPELIPVGESEEFNIRYWAGDPPDEEMLQAILFEIQVALLEGLAGRKRLFPPSSTN